MPAHQKFNYVEIKEEIIKNTQELLMCGDWSSLNSILNSSPNQLIKYCNFSNFEKKIMLDDKSIIESYFMEKNNNIYLSSPVNFILSILAEDHRIFTKEFKELILNKILPCSEKLSGNAQEYINNALGRFLIGSKKEKLTAYPRLFDNLISKFPAEIANFIPKIVELEWWMVVYYIIRLYPKLIKLYPKEIEKLIKNHTFNRYQFNEFRDLLSQHNMSLYNLLLEEQEYRGTEFLKEFLSLTKDLLTDDWIRRTYSYFSPAIYIYSDEELKRIIKKLIKFKINNFQNNAKSSFIRDCLYTISTSGKSYLFKYFLQPLKNLGYTQFVSDFIRKNPSEKKIIKNYDISIMDIYDPDHKINSQNLDLLYGKNLVEAFKELLESNSNKSTLISLFFNAKLNHIEEFTKILQEFYDNIDFGSNEKDNYFEYHSILFARYPSYSEEFFIKKLKEYLSNEKNREWFNPWPCPNFSKYFDRIDEVLQKEIIKLLIERKRYNCIIYSMRRSPNKFYKYIDDFLLINSQNESEIRGILIIYEVIIRNFSADEKILNKILTKIKRISQTYDKGQLLSFLGEKIGALDCFSEVIKKKISISQVCFIFTDYLIEYLDVNQLNIDIAKSKEIEEELHLIENDFEIFNINKESSKRFPFKIKFLKARFMLFYGIICLNIDNYNYAREKLSVSHDIFRELAQSTNIPAYNKDIINVYEIVSSILPDFIERIKNLKETNRIETLNQEFLDQIKNIKSTIFKYDFKTKRIVSSLENFKFNENGKLTYLPFELPINFCPLPPLIEPIYIEVKQLGQKYFPWDRKSNLKPTSDPLDIFSDYQQIILLQKFVKNEGINYYNLEVGGPNFIKTNLYPPEYKNGLNIFKFDIASEKFLGKRDLKLVLKPNDICLVGTDLKLTIRYVEQQSESSNDLIKEIIIENIIACIYQFQEKIQITKESENHFSGFLSSLINNRINHRKWHIEEQKPSGKSATSDKRKWESIGGLGELDFAFVNENDMILTICEALVLKSNDKKTINDHLLKIFNYDATGLPFNFIIVYSKVVNFDKLWPKYKETVLNIPFKYELKEKCFFDESDHYNLRINLRMGKTAHIREGKPTELYHFFINTNI